MTLAVKNMFGTVAGLTKAKYHSLNMKRAAFADMLLDVLSMVPPHLNILDGVVGMEGRRTGNGRDARHAGRRHGLDGCVAMDISVCRMLGLEPASTPVLRAARLRGLWPSEITYPLLVAARRGVPRVRAAEDRGEAGAHAVPACDAGVHRLRGLHAHLPPLRNNDEVENGRPSTTHAASAATAAARSAPRGRSRLRTSRNIKVVVFIFPLRRVARGDLQSIADHQPTYCKTVMSSSTPSSEKSSPPSFSSQSPSSSASSSTTFIEKYLARLAKKTATTLDDEIIKNIKKPIYFLVMLDRVLLRHLPSHRLDILRNLHRPRSSSPLEVFLIAFIITRIINVFVAWYAERKAKQAGKPLSQNILIVFRKVAPRHRLHLRVHRAPRHQPHRPLRRARRPGRRRHRDRLCIAERAGRRLQRLLHLL